MARTVKEKQISDRERQIKRIFSSYYANKKTLREDYNFPSITATDYSRVVVQTDKSKNIQEDKIINYADRKTVLCAEVFIVEETLQYFRLEGHGREKFVEAFFIKNYSWAKTEMECNVSVGTLSYWQRDVIEKAEILGKWIGYFKE